MPSLDVSAHSQDDRCVVRLRGELDIATGDDLGDRLRDIRRSHGEHLVLDLTDVTFMDSHGLSVLINCYKSVGANGGSLTLAAPRPVVRRTLEVMGLHRRIPVVPTI